MTAACITAVLSFAGTNIDDIFVLMILYAQTRTTRGIMQVIIGQYLGIGVLVGLSVLGAMGTQLFPPEYIGLLGILPLLLGIRSLIVYRKEQGKHEHKHEPQRKAGIGIFQIALLTIANGADNIGVYMPVFSSCSLPEMVVTVAVFAVMIGLWCYLGMVLAGWPYIRDKINRYQHVLVPLVLMGIGTAILVENYIL